MAASTVREKTFPLVGTISNNQGLSTPLASALHRIASRLLALRIRLRLTTLIALRDGACNQKINGLIHPAFVAALIL
jgi:hypothetical protein